MHSWLCHQESSTTPTAAPGRYFTHTDVQYRHTPLQPLLFLHTDVRQTPTSQPTLSESDRGAKALFLTAWTLRLNGDFTGRFTLRTNY